MIFDLEKVLREGKVFLVRSIVLYQMKRQLGRSLNLVHLECKCVCPIWKTFCSCWGIKRVFSNLLRCGSKT